MHFEHYLAWTDGALVELVNDRLRERDVDERAELGSCVRYGVGDRRALVLMTSGIRSRRLAHAISADVPADLEPHAMNAPISSLHRYAGAAPL